jgi:hypothetical protein
MKKLAIVLLAFAASLSAADFSGIWNGKGGREDPKYGLVPDTAQMTLLQGGASVTGTFKFGNAKPVAISSGTVSGTQVTIAIVGSGAQVTGRFTQNGAQLVGKMTTSSGQIYDLVFTKN